MWDDFDAYTYANFFLGIFYGALLLIGIIMYIVSFKKQFHSTSFILFFVLGVSVRGIAFVVEPFVVQRSLIVPNAVNFLLTTISAFFLFSTYLVLLSLWGETYSDSYGPKDNLPLTSPKAGPITLRKVTFVVNVLMYVVAAILYGLDFHAQGLGTDDDFSVATTLYEYAIFIFVCVMYIVITAAFFVYGYIVYRNNFYARGALGRSEGQKKTLRTLGTFGIICIACFAVRSLLVALQLRYKEIADAPGSIVTYYVCLEIFPLVLMLLVVRTASLEQYYDELSPNRPLIT